MRFLRQVLESFRFAWQALRSNLLRTTLSLLGVTVGIFSIIAVFTLVDSLERNVKDSVNVLGSNALYIQKIPWTFDGPFQWWKYFQRPELKYADFRYLHEHLEDAEAVAAASGKNGVTVKNGNNSMKIRLSGVTSDYNQVTDVALSDGRYFTAQEQDGSRNAVILGSEVAETLFPGQDPVGQGMKVAGLNFTIIGIQEKKGSGVLEIGGSADKRCLIPYNTYAKYFASLNPSITIFAKGYDSDPGLENLEGEIRGIMRTRRSLKPTQEDNFAINRPEALFKFISGIFAVLTTAGWVIGGFSILIGGFGIANIMFVSVKERVNIIGIQKSLGAKNYFILFQFLFESVLLSLVGGLAGIALVYLLSFIQLGTLTLELTIGNISLGLGVSSVIGVLAGIIPAYSASRLDPVIAIRSK